MDGVDLRGEPVAQVVAGSPLADRYAEAVDRESAHELLRERMEQAALAAQEQAAAAELEKERLADEKQAEKEQAAAQRAAERRAAAQEKARQQQRSAVSKGLESALRSAGTVIGREISRSLFGTRRRR